MSRFLLTLSAVVVGAALLVGTSAPTVDARPPAPKGKHHHAKVYHGKVYPGKFHRYRHRYYYPRYYSTRVWCPRCECYRIPYWCEMCGRYHVCPFYHEEE
jgi:hypothetical protein